MQVGNAGVGKTSILEQYSEGVFEERDIKNNSLMVDFRVKTIRVGSSTVKLQVGSCEFALPFHRFGTLQGKNGSGDTSPFVSWFDLS